MLVHKKYQVQDLNPAPQNNKGITRSPNTITNIAVAQY